MENYPNYNPFDSIINRLEQMQIRLDIISANLPKEKALAPPKDPNDILDTKAMSKILGVPESTVRIYINDADERFALPATMPGKGHIIKRCDLENWINNVYLNIEFSKRSKKSQTEIAKVAPPFMLKVHKQQEQ